MIFKSFSASSLVALNLLGVVFSHTAMHLSPKVLLTAAK